MSRITPGNTAFGMRLRQQCSGIGEFWIDRYGKRTDVPEGIQG